MRYSHAQIESVTSSTVEHMISDSGEVDLQYNNLDNTSRIKNYLEPEHKLMSALLSDGIQAYVDAINKGLEQDEAFEWVESENDEEYIFSFEQVCTALGLSHCSVRSALVTMKEQNKASNSDDKVKWKRVRRPRIQ